MATVIKRKKKVRKLTEIGKLFVAIINMIAVAAVAFVLSTFMVEGLEAEGRIRDAQNAPYIKAMQQREVKSYEDKYR